MQYQSALLELEGNTLAVEDVSVSEISGKITRFVVTQSGLRVVWLSRSEAAAAGAVYLTGLSVFGVLTAGVGILAVGASVGAISGATMGGPAKGAGYYYTGPDPQILVSKKKLFNGDLINPRK